MPYQGRVAHLRGGHAVLGVGTHLAPDQLRHQRGDLGHPGRVRGRDLQHLASGLRLQLVRRPGRDHPAVVEDHDVVRELVGLVQVLGGQQYRDPVRHQPADHPPDIGPAAGVEPGGRLVQVQHPGVANQAGRQVEPAPHAARIGLGRPCGGLGQLEAGEQLARPGPDVRPRHAEQAADHDEVVGPGQALVYRRVLPGEADELPHLVGVPQHVVAADADLAAVRPEQRGEDPNRRGLASPVRPEHPEHPALPGRQVHPVQRGRLAEPLDQPGRLDRISCRVISHVSIVAHATVRTRTRICQPSGAPVRIRSAPCQRPASALPGPVPTLWRAYPRQTARTH